MHSKNGNIEFMPYNNQIKLLTNLLSPFFRDTKLVSKHKENPINFSFDSVQFLYYKCHKISFNVTDHM